MSQAIGNTIEIFRKDKKMTKTALAEFAWLERRYLMEIVQGDKRPTVNAVYSICTALNISPLEFFRKVEEEIARLNMSAKKG
ncbi:MAG: helix-turn-helix domain-containing protein [Deltaproteobacteria bacterium]|nr:helix-turn-helix domain-containing protein [Deltaproteobacteria bacterium]